MAPRAAWRVIASSNTPSLPTHPPYRRVSARRWASRRQYGRAFLLDLPLPYWRRWMTAIGVYV
jgi:hypothetical protein